MPQQFMTPSFMIIGAVKGGTTTLFHWLAKHPAMAAPCKKELVFFDQDHEYQKGFAYYHSQYPSFDITAKKISFEASPAYLYSKKAAARLFAYKPNLKLIILLRDPIARAYSHWNMYRIWQTRGIVFGDKYDEIHRNKLHALFANPILHDFTQLVRYEMQIIKSREEEKILATFLRHGLYYQQITRYLEYFPRNQLFIIESQALKLDRLATLRKLTDFLQCEPFADDVASWPLSHVHAYQTTLDEYTRNLLAEFYHEPNRQLYQLLDCDFAW